MGGTNLILQLVKPTAADARVRRIYDDTRRTLHLPWVGALFQGYAMYPAYLALAWDEPTGAAGRDAGPARPPVPSGPTLTEPGKPPPGSRGRRLPPVGGRPLPPLRGAR